MAPAVPAALADRRYIAKARHPMNYHKYLQAAKANWVDRVALIEISYHQTRQSRGDVPHNPACFLENLNRRTVR